MTDLVVPANLMNVLDSCNLTFKIDGYTAAQGEGITGVEIYGTEILPFEVQIEKDGAGFKARAMIMTEDETDEVWSCGFGEARAVLSEVALQLSSRPVELAE